MDTCRRITTVVRCYEIPTGRKGEHEPPLKILLAVFRNVTQQVVIQNYHYSLRNIPHGRSSQLLRGGSLKSRILLECYVY
jgi:hypothetical protein